MAAVRCWRRADWKAARLDIVPQRRLPELGIRIMRDIARRLVGGQQLEDHASCSLGPIGLGLDFHAGGGFADAARSQRTLALDLDHADAAVAVGPITRLRRVTQMRQLDAVAARGA